MPKSLRTHAQWVSLSGVPALLVHPDFGTGNPISPRPFLLWMHGRSANKELDNGRYLRLVRQGIASVAVDLPGHGERLENSMQVPQRSMEVLETMLHELTGVERAIQHESGFDLQRAAVGGMSLGGMVALARLCTHHTFKAAWVEATTGDWSELASSQFDPVRAEKWEPLRHLDQWQPVPLLALHAELDKWMPVESQRTFLSRVANVNRGLPVEFKTFPATGAPHEHIGFGSFAPQAKDAGVAFLITHLQPNISSELP